MFHTWCSERSSWWPWKQQSPECELDINNETVERTKYGKKPERETESSGIKQRAGETWHLSYVCSLLEKWNVFGTTSKKKDHGNALLDRGKWAGYFQGIVPFSWDPKGTSSLAMDSFIGLGSCCSMYHVFYPTTHLCSLQLFVERNNALTALPVQHQCSVLMRSHQNTWTEFLPLITWWVSSGIFASVSENYF